MTKKLDLVFNILLTSIISVLGVSFSPYPLGFIFIILWGVAFIKFVWEVDKFEDKQ